MPSLIHADIFFFVTTIVVAVVGVALLVLLIVIIVWFRKLFRIAGIVEEETRRVAGDVEELRGHLKENVRGWRAKWGVVKRFFKKIFNRWLTL